MTKSRKIILEFVVRGKHPRPICSSLVEVRTDGFEWVEAAARALRQARLSGVELKYATERAIAISQLLAKKEELDAVPPDDINRLIGVSFKGPSLCFGINWFLSIKQVRIVVPGRLDSTINSDRTMACEKTTNEPSAWRTYCDTVSKYVTERLASFEVAKIGTYHLVAKPSLGGVKNNELVITIMKFPTQSHYVDTAKVGEIDTPNEGGTVLLQLAPTLGVKWLALLRPLDEVCPDITEDVWTTVATVRIPRAVIGDVPWVTWE